VYGSPGSRESILFISSAEHPGADTYIHTLIIRHLNRRHFDVHVACPAGSAGARPAGYDVMASIPDVTLRPTHFGPSLSQAASRSKSAIIKDAAWAPGSFLGLVRYVRRHRISLIHSTDRPRDAVACALLGRTTGATSVIHAHLKCADWMGRSLRSAMGRADVLVGVSKFVTESLVENGYERSKCHAVLNGIDLSRWDYRFDGAAVRREFAIPPDAPVIACAARLFKGKGQDDLITVLPQVRREFPEARVLIVGADDRAAMRTSFSVELKQLAANLGLTDHVIFTGLRTDMPAIMAACDIFALPSNEEPFGLVFLEAMAMKKPVVALNNGGTPEVVEHGKAGLLSAPADLPGLATNLCQLLRSPALRAEFGEYGRRTVEAYFTAERMAENMERLYASLLSSASPAAVRVRSRPSH
jgi:glycosyltransferase involved in cell wall biosynthesis